MSKLIELIIAPNGDVRVRTKGFAGASCRDASRFLEEALGTKSHERLTADFYRPAEIERQIAQEGGD